ncbi:MAG: hypothetical protein AAFP92_28745 [Bacteroidota bacterium]
MRILPFFLAETYDPYDKGYLYPADSLNPQFLVLKRNGVFQEYDSVNQSHGRWYVNKEGKSLALVYEQQNGIAVPEERRSPLFRYHLYAFSPDSLKLGIQGRHGMIEKLYLKEGISYSPVFMGDSNAMEQTEEVFPVDSMGDWAEDSLVGTPIFSKDSLQIPAAVKDTLTDSIVFEADTSDWLSKKDSLLLQGDSLNRR